MNDPKSHDIQEIETLLANRERLAEWLERLDDAGSRAPSAVRAKVRADYQGRLAQVVVQLSTHREVVGTTLEGLRSQATEIQQLRQDETDIRAEAELRHAVGEYSDDEWQRVDHESTGKIAGFEHELGRLGGEIGRLEEVQALIVPSGSRAAVRPAEPIHAPSSPAPAPIHEPQLSLSPPSPPGLQVEAEEAPPPPQPRPEAPRFVPRGGSFPREQYLPTRPPTPRATAVPSAIPTPAPSSAPAPSPAASGSGREDELTFLRTMNVEVLNPSPRPASAQPSGVEAEPRAPTAMPKTLKCADCGSLNRATDWYCERCGAELAAV